MSQAWSGGYVSEAHGALGVPMGQLELSAGKASPAAHGQASQ